MPTVKWSWFDFDKLSKDLLFDLIVLRQDIFVVEQQCCYPELDQKDKQALHLLGFEDRALVATLRLLPPGVSYEEASIGRVALHEQVRGRGLGREMMLEALGKAVIAYNGAAIKISAQAHLQRFYESLGFQTITDPYLEDGIPHIAMRYHVPDGSRDV